MTKFQKILKEIRSGAFYPVYFWSGEEPYFGRKAEAELLKYVVDEQAKTFDEIILYGNETSLDDILLQAGRFPMMGSKQLMVVREAQYLFKKDKAIQQLKSYLSAPHETTVISFRYSGKPGAKIKNALSKSQNIIYHEAKPLYENQVADFIMTLFEDYGFQADYKSALMMTQLIGTNLSRAEHELEKLSLVLKENEKITPDKIEEYIGISKDFNIFEFKTAIVEGNLKKARKIAWFFQQNPKEHPILMILSILYNFFSKLYAYHLSKNKSNRGMLAKELGVNPYFLKEYEQAARVYPMKRVSRVISVLRELDLKAKGMNAGSAGYEDLMNELIFKVILSS